ncbi:MAG: SPFH domain-containing protein [Planctomycetota bacterium]
MSADDKKIPEGWPPPPGKRSGGRGGAGEFKPPKGLLLALVLLAFFGALIFLFISGQGGIVDIADTEVAVVVNYMTGDEEIITTPGVIIFIPWFNEAFILDKSPNEFVMEGRQDLSTNHVRELSVRAKDGSSFRFSSMTIQYQLIPSKAAVVLQNSGPSESFKRNWVRAFARSVLRDEFGSYASNEIADPSNYSTATVNSKLKLNKLLEPHGIEIIQIITPKPSFDDAVEQAIEDRKNANQEVERLRIEQTKLTQEEIQLMAEAERTKASEFELTLGILKADKIIAEKDRIQVEKSADAFKITEVNAGLAQEAKQLQQARAMEVSARKEAEGLTARVEALETRGSILVREKLAEKLAAVNFRVVPYRRDPTPVRIEHIGSTHPDLVPAANLDRNGGNR